MGWLGKTLTRKFILLLAGFLMLQLAMLVIGILGVKHLGEEGAFINEAGRQRYRTLLVIVRAEEVLRGGAPVSEMNHLLEDIDVTFVRFKDFLANGQRYEGLAFHGAYHIQLREEVIRAEEIWRRELRPLADSVGRTNLVAARTALTQYKVAAPQQVERLETIVTMLEQDVRHNTDGLVKFSVTVLGVSFLLGLVGFGMAIRIVSRPLRRLIEAANAIAGGAYDKRVTVSSRDEIGEMAQTFNRMAIAISEKTSRIAALNDIAVKITSVQSLRELLDEIMLHGMQLSGAQGAGIAFYEEATHTFEERITEGLSSDYVRNMNVGPGSAIDRVFLSETFIISNDRPETGHQLNRQDRQEGIQCIFSVPLISHASKLGVLSFYRKDRDFFLADEIEILRTFAHLAAGAVENTRLYEKTQHLAVTDKLTGLRNRRMFDQRLAEEIAYAERQGKPLSLLMIDIDNFKKVNDVHGHVVGDKVLQALGKTISGQLWKVDLAARYGGEEFAIILPQTDASAATNVAERIRRSVAQTRIPLSDRQDISVTISIGIASLPECGRSSEELIEHADQALYTAKREGKNRVAAYRDLLKTRLEADPDHIVSLLNQGLGNIRLIMTAVSAKTPYFHEHAAIVGRVAKQLANALNLPENEREMLELSSQLHDMGMITVPDAILAKKHELTGEDWEVIRKHPETAAGFLEKIPALRRIAPVVRHHHERFDGKGYPDGLKGEAIPYLSRVLAVVDVYAAMMGECEGHQALSHVEVRARLLAAAGSQLDPQIVSTLVRLLDAEHLSPGAGALPSAG